MDKTESGFAVPGVYDFAMQKIVENFNVLEAILKNQATTEFVKSQGYLDKNSVIDGGSFSD